MWLVAATPNISIPEDEDFFVCPQSWIVDSIMHWPHDTLFRGNSMQRNRALLDMVKKMVVPEDDWMTITNYRLVRNGKVFGKLPLNSSRIFKVLLKLVLIDTIKEAMKCESQEVNKQKTTTAESDDEGSESGSRTGVHQNGQSQMLNLNHLARKSIETFDPNALLNLNNSKEIIFQDANIDDISILDENGVLVTTIYPQSNPELKSEKNTEPDYEIVDDEGDGSQGASGSEVQEAEKTNKANDDSEFLYRFTQEYGLQIDDVDGQTPGDTLKKIHKDIQGVKGALVVCMSEIRSVLKSVQTIKELLLSPLAVKDNKLYSFPIKSDEDLRKFNRELGQNEELFKKIVSSNPFYKF